MKSSDDMVDSPPPAPDQRFDLTSLSLDETAWQKFVRRFDPWVQLARLLVIVVVIIVWESEWIYKGFKLGIEFAPFVPELFRGTPSEIWDYFGEIWHEKLFWTDLWVTLREAFYGFLLGGSAGFTVGIVLGRFRRIGKVFDPFLIFVNAVPKIAFAPMLILFYGVDIASKVALATIIVFFIVQIPVQSAVSSVDPDIDTVATTMGATELQKFRWVVIPSILGPLFGALRLAAIYAILSVVFGEFLASKRGLGQRLLFATNNFKMGQAFALMIILAVIALLFNFVIGTLERRFLRYQGNDAQGQVAAL